MSANGADPRQLSPLTIPYRIVEQSIPVAFGIVAVSQAGLSALREFPFGVVAGVAVALLAFVGVAVREVLYYQRYRYAVTGEALVIESGVVSRREREVPLRRIQNVDITRNVVQRALGIAAVNFETAGGSGTEAVLRYVDADEARRLQRVVRRGDVEAEGERAEDEGEELFSLSGRELALVGLLSFDARVPAAVIAIATGSAPLLSAFVPVNTMTILGFVGIAGAVALAGLLAWAAGAAVAVANYYGFRLVRDGGDLRYERGLLRRYAGSIPTDKIQTLTVEENPLMRRFGYATLVIETAGYAPGGNQNQKQAAVPLARRERVGELARDIEAFGNPEFARPPRRIRRRYAVRYSLALAAVTVGLYALDAFVVTDTSLPWFVPLALVVAVPAAAHYTWVHRGYWLDSDHFLTRTGFWTRRTKVVPYYRIQTVIESANVFQRRWSVASVVADTAGSISLVGGDAVAIDVEADEATRLRGELDARLRAAVERRRRGDAEESDDAGVSDASGDGAEGAEGDEFDSDAA